MVAMGTSTQSTHKVKQSKAISDNANVNEV